MLDDLSRNVRFRKWVEALVRSENPDYPDRAARADDARAFLNRQDQMRRDLRALEERTQGFRAELAELVGGDARTDDAELLQAVRDALKRAGREDRLADDRSREQLVSLRSELEAASAKLEATRGELDKERRKLEPVVRYAYNLRRLVQHIHASGAVTPDIMKNIEKLLAAGGVVIRKQEQAARNTRRRGDTASETSGR